MSILIYSDLSLQLSNTDLLYQDLDSILSDNESKFIISTDDWDIIINIMSWKNLNNFYGHIIEYNKSNLSLFHGTENP